jgi:hypothetical protein
MSRARAAVQARHAFHMTPLPRDSARARTDTFRSQHDFSGSAWAPLEFNGLLRCRREEALLDSGHIMLAAGLEVAPHRAAGLEVAPHRAAGLEGPPHRMGCHLALV